ncbi:DNAH1 [Bugula neritina]|uniref:DNAH1 n=1 Tax=Bugula neritina TaxID=10212 RepID=A0A7J7JQW1_BUGNE|nr:DNAH1 [Bugula neritina]
MTICLADAVYVTCNISGAWACFDEFNRIDIEVLSVVAQQIATIQQGLKQRVDRFMFEGVELDLRQSCAVFITMNPGYAGRTELPDNLKALFRPVAMMVPDYALIAEISLFSFGFSDARVLAKKITSTFSLSSEQLSSQDHYDFGMRAVKSVISAAGNLKRQNPTMSEELICLRAIRDVNVPKFLMEDLKLFTGIVSDLFPNIKEEPIDYGELESALRKQCLKLHLKDVDLFIHKCIQLYETTVVRHGLMLVGPTGSGKTKCYEVLKNAQTSLNGIESPSGDLFVPTHSYVLNPKSITMGQLYGEFDLMTHEWTDGILSTLIRLGCAADDVDKRWFVFDGPVDAVWIENMNTVLDDNKKLCLSSGEIIKLTNAMTMMFEVQDLAVASPATVSRCGMVYLEPGNLGLEPFVDCYLKCLPDLIYPFKDKFKTLFDQFMEFVRKNTTEIVGTVDSSLVLSLFKMIDCFLSPYVPKEEPIQIPQERLDRIGELIEPWFIFSLLWSVGGTVDNNGRKKFDAFLREKMKEHSIGLQFPEQGLVYDYKLNDAGLTSADVDDGEDDDDADNKKEKDVCWQNWMHRLDKFEVLCVGPTGTGKSLAISDKLINGMPSQYVPEFIVFSAKTSANQTQDLIDGKLDKRRKGVFGPPLGKQMVFFIDDLNMPALEVYGAQPPIELIRQWCDFKGWYDRKAIGDFRNLVDVNFVAAMGPPGGGRNPVTPRLMRHFNFLSFTELEDESQTKIFGTILQSWTSQAPPIAEHNIQLTKTTMSVYSTITNTLLPTPAKSHYTFNLRDLSKVFQGILMFNPTNMPDLPALLRLWYHESCRVFQDRLVNNDDRQWFDDLCKQKMKEDFGQEFEEVVVQSPLLYGDFMTGDTGTYEEIVDHTKMVKVIDEFLDDYNQVNTAQMKLVLFNDAVRHVCRIGRIVRQPLGNALLLGMGGSGRQSLTRLAAHIADFTCFQIELSKNYGMTEWRDDLKKVMLQAGLESKATVFLFSDTRA